MKKVSVILTTYNASDVIKDTIHSILHQDGINKEFEIELIAIDDCSSDNTAELIKEFDVTLLSTTKNSGGPNTGRNMGIKIATGDYFCIADQDDIWKSHKIKTLLPYLEKVPIVTSGFTVIDSTTKKESHRINQSETGSVYFEKNKTFLSKLTKSRSGQNIYLGSLIYRKELSSILFEEVFGMVDFDWHLRLFHNNDSIEVSDSLYVRYVEGGNLSLDLSYRLKDFYYSLYFIESYGNLYPSEVRHAKLKINGSRARYHYKMGDMKEARFYFLRSKWELKTILYYLTTFVGSKYVLRKFDVFG